MPAITEVPITIETRDHLLEDVIATVESNEESYIREPHSWGQSRGSATVCNSVRIKTVHLGNHEMPRAALVEWVGERAVSRQEELACEIINQMLGGGCVMSDGKFDPTHAAIIDATKKLERERCARIAEAHADTYKAAFYVSVCQKVAEEIAADIRQSEHLKPEDV